MAVNIELLAQELKKLIQHPAVRRAGASAAGYLAAPVPGELYIGAIGDHTSHQDATKGQYRALMREFKGKVKGVDPGVKYDSFIGLPSYLLNAAAPLLAYTIRSKLKGFKV